MMNKLKNFFLNSQVEFRFRIFRLVLSVGSVVALASIFEGIALGYDMKAIASSCFLFLAMIIGAILMFRFQKPEWAVFSVGVVMVLIAFPMIFLTCGGINGGASIWFVIGIFYLFIMYSGKTMIVFVTVAALVDTLTYVLAYHYPEYVTGGGDRGSAYIDSAFSVIMVGIAVGILLKYQIRQYEREQEIAIAQKNELEKLELSRNQFFSNMSHELRTPINSIVGLNELILRAEIPEDVVEHALAIDDSGKLLLSLVNDILDMAQIETNKLVLVPIEYGMRDLFMDVIHMMQAGMKEKGLDFYVNIDGNLPSGVYGDVKRVKQILLNLLSNATKYTSSGAVTLSAHGDLIGEEWVRLTVVVSDTGNGIRKEEISHLFESFHRVNDRESAKVEGTGLGLAICKQLLDLMGGEITVDSTYTKGSDFTVIIEQKIVDITPIGAINYENTSRGMDRKRYKQSFEAPEARVLIVDDNAMNLKVAAKLLMPTKMQIDTVQSGEECLQMTKKKNYQVILMDHLMPGMDGIETLNAIRVQKNGLCRETPVLALTANAEANSDEMYRKHGFQGYLCKPIKGEDLEKEVLRLLPDVLVEYQAAKQDMREISSSSNGYLDRFGGKRKKKVCITTDCVSDLPQEIVQSLDIKMMCLYITTKYARFRDTVEITSDNLDQYAGMIGSELYADSASVEEFEGFFAQALSEAEEVIHISLASKTGVSYGVACQAARGFGHVHVINSGHISGGEGLLVLEAVKMAKEEDKSVLEICQELENLSKRIHTTFLLPSARIFHQRGYLKNKYIARICDALMLHPILAMRGSELKLSGFLWGRKEKSWRLFIRWISLSKKRISTEVVYITHVGLSVRQLEKIKGELMRHVQFKEVRIEKASVSNACNSGIGTVGISVIYK